MSESKGFNLCLTVNLPKSHLPLFPNRCVVCNRIEPGSFVRLVTTSSGFLSLLIWAATFMYFSVPLLVRAPACAKCGWRLHRMRFASWLIGWACIGIAVYFSLPYLAQFQFWVQVWIALGISILALLPYTVYKILYPDPFSVTANPKDVDYEFTSRVYALQFALLNRDAAWVKLNGELLDWDDETDIDSA